MSIVTRVGAVSGVQETDSASGSQGEQTAARTTLSNEQQGTSSACGDSAASDLTASGGATGADARDATAPRRIVAIDGPAGAGKSTVAARLAERFGLLNLETGAMYRAFALKALSHQLALDNARALEELAQRTTITLEPGEAGNRVLLDGADVTAELRSPEVTQGASQVSVHAGIRAWMVALQRELGAGGGVVMEGRDIGTAVFPDADVKVFLDASPEARSQRRYQQASGAEPASAAEDQSQAEAILAEMRERDRRDRTRAESPLRPAEDAVVIDSTQLTLDQVIEQVAALVTARWAGAPRR